MFFRSIHFKSMYLRDFVIINILLKNKQTYINIDLNNMRSTSKQFLNIAIIYNRTIK